MVKWEENIQWWLDTNPNSVLHWTACCSPLQQWNIHENVWLPVSESLQFIVPEAFSVTLDLLSPLSPCMSWRCLICYKAEKVEHPALGDPNNTNRAFVVASWLESHVLIKQKSLQFLRHTEFSTVLLILKLCFTIMLTCITQFN